MDEKITNELKNTIGCTTPFVEDKSNICKNQTLGKKAIDIAQKLYKDKVCAYPCKYLTNFGITSAPSAYPKTPGIKSKNVFLFGEYGQSYKAMYTYTSLDLFAALGGYIGVFLGVSLFNIKDLIHFGVRLMSKRF